MKSIKVKRIKKGSTIGIFSPSEPIVEKRISRFNAGISILKSNGFKTKLATNALKITNYTAGTVSDRVSDLHELLRANDVDVLVSSWGGKSCNQLIKHLDYNLIKEKRKAILGFSDAGVLLNHINAKTGLITFYGPNVIGKLDETDHENMTILNDDFFQGNILGNVENVNSQVIKSGTSEGKLIGGNLSTFVLGVACSEIPDSYFDGAIFFWEDAGNAAQIINQYLTAISNRGIFDRISGMIIGDFITEDTNEWKRTNDFDSIKQVLGNYNFPILYAPTFGHRKLENPLIPIGAKCRLDANKYSLKLLETIIE
ncbi:MAG: LD-carboxypeptidase [Bacteroidales bacterium]|nr:LD-carboxypeptidase [Bacteroidales bacterium]